MALSPLINTGTVMNKIPLPFLLMCIGMTLSSVAWADSSQRWTLAASVQHALEVAPEMQIADAEIGIKQGVLQKESAWPNPSIEIQVDDKLGIEDAAGGYDFTQLAISQPLPMSRLPHQRR